MKKTLPFLLIIMLSNPLYSKVLLDEEESRSMDEAMKTVEKSKKDRKEFNLEDEKVKRDMATEQDPKFKKDFDKLMDDLK